MLYFRWCVELCWFDSVMCNSIASTIARERVWCYLRNFQFINFIGTSTRMICSTLEWSNCSQIVWIEPEMMNELATQFYNFAWILCLFRIWRVLFALRHLIKRVNMVFYKYLIRSAGQYYYCHFELLDLAYRKKRRKTFNFINMNFNPIFSEASSMSFRTLSFR